MTRPHREVLAHQRLATGLPKYKDSGSFCYHLFNIARGQETREDINKIYERDDR